MKLHFVNIAPLFTDHVDEVADDLKQLASKGDFDETAFKFTLVPEGSPVIDKAAVLGDAFVQYRKAMKARGLQAGMLIQATMGHGWVPESPSSFDKFIKSDLSQPYIHCPLGKDFQKYVHDSIRHLASLQPDFMMVDDDFRMMTIRGGCFCPLHMKRFNELTGHNYTAEELRDAVKNDADLNRRFRAFQGETLNELAAIIRQAIDEVNPHIPCSFCCCSDDLDHANLIASTLAAPGQEPIVRINNGRYLRNNPDFASWLGYTRAQLLALPPETAVLTEADTCPQNRLSTDSAIMHVNITLALLQGFAGAKLWITRLSDYQPASGKAYRRTLAENAPLYQAIRDLQPRWHGINSPFPKGRINWQALFASSWGNAIFSLMGLPFHYDFPDDGPAMLNGDTAVLFTDDEIRAMLAQPLLLDGTAAENLASRGLGEFLGYDAMAVPEQTVSIETFRTSDGRELTMTGGVRSRVFVNVSPAAEQLSQFYHKSWPGAAEKTSVGPGAIRFRNRLGGTVVTLGAYIGPYDLSAFFMLNEFRKLQLIDILRSFNCLDIAYAGDTRVICQCGKAASGERLCYFCSNSNDVLDELPVCGTGLANANFRQLLPDGSWQPVTATPTTDGAVLNVRLNPLAPVVLAY